MSAAQDTAERLRREVDLAIQRGFKGVNYLTSGAPEVGQSRKDVLATRGTMRLYHYHPLVDEVYRVPVLIVMATTNRGYILDLAPGNSFVEYLLKAGYDVFMLDWAAPVPAEKNLRIEDYVLDFIPDCLRRIRKETGENDVSIAGYCFGGVLSLLFTALAGKEGPKNLVCFTTPIDFKQMKLFQNWSSQKHFDVDRLVDTYGNVPPEMIHSSFEMLRPASRAAAQVTLWDNIWNDEFVRGYRQLDRWGNDTLPLAGEYFRQTTKELMWGNKLFTGELTIGGKRVDLGAIKQPILHAVAEHDHIVPYEAARHLIARVGSKDKTEVILKGGHVSLLAGPNAARRMWPKLDEWLGERST
ncbi:MAG: alpha/beta fold hydrolase [Methylobacteriaceae bacterium]|nr:alpha/beta fold hydrolase [Methylobacteriaceae bacterium]HPG02246.1 alpha/beta fold hydrolase [Rhodoblastus sp.]